MNENPNSTATGDGSKELLLFQMGPVQEFIAQAATPSDLWAGSYLLSDLILAGIKSVPDFEERMIFPNLKDGTVLSAMQSEHIPTIPNRFLAFVPSGEGMEIADNVKKAIKAKLESRGKECFGKDELPKEVQTQLDQFLQMTWAVLRHPCTDMGANYKKISRILALRRNVREFDPWHEDSATRHNGRNGEKDFLSGKETALKDGRGAMNLIKQELPAVVGKAIPKIETLDDKYLAVIAVDGDKMGATLSGLAEEKDHREFSKRLAEFAMSAKEKMPERGVLLYSGGDDVLAVVPAKTAIDTARELAEAFAEKMKVFTWKGDDGKDNPVSASAGIAIGHEATPLLDMVEAAQSAEARAKNAYDRNALALSVFKRSGEILEWGCNWDSKALALHREITKTLKDELSARFPYKLAELLEPYSLEDWGKKDKLFKDIASDDMQAIILKELEHAWERSAKENSPEREVAARYLGETFGKKRPQDFLNLFLCETFINRQRNGED